MGDKGLDEDLLVGEVGQQGQQELDQVLGELEADAPFYENKDALNCCLEKVKLLLHLFNYTFYLFISINFLFFFIFSFHLTSKIFYILF